MTPETSPETTETPIALPKKQYLVLTDELSMLLLAKIMPTLQFLEVSGMNMDNNNDFMVMVTPKLQPAPTES